MTENVRIYCVDHTDESTARAIHGVRILAYAHEAELLGAIDFPPLRATIEDIRYGDEEFLVAYLPEGTVGSVSVRPEPEGIGRNIASLVVTPAYHRRGIGRLLLQEVLGLYGAAALTVQTGARNEPALALYKGAGFGEVRRWFVGREPLELVKLFRGPSAQTLY